MHRPRNSFGQWPLFDSCEEWLGIKFQIFERRIDLQSSILRVVLDNVSEPVKHWEVSFVSIYREEISQREILVEDPYQVKG